MKILIVDENLDKRIEICKLLNTKPENFKVFDAEDFNSAIDIAETKEPDLFFSIWILTRALPPDLFIR